jgi:hypothetical protein
MGELIELPPQGSELRFPTSPVNDRAAYSGKANGAVQGMLMG